MLPLALLFREYTNKNFVEIQNNCLENGTGRVAQRKVWGCMQVLHGSNAL